MKTEQVSKIEEVIDTALADANKPITAVGIVARHFGANIEKRKAPKIFVRSELPLTHDEAARVAEALEAEGFEWEIAGATLNPVEVSDNVVRRSKSVPRIKRGAK